MEKKNFNRDAYSVIYLFGIGWFLPYCAYTLWAYGIHPVDLGSIPFLMGDKFGWFWRLVLAHPVELTMLSQLGIGCLFITASRNLTWSMLGFRRTSAVWFFIAIAGIILSYLFSGFLQEIFQAPGNAGIPAGAGVQTSAAQPIGQILGALLIIGFATAVIEEVAFRGVLYRWFRMNMGPIMAIVISALIFSLFHLRFINPGGLPGIGATLQVMFGGIVLASLFEKSGSLWPSIYLHSVNNVIGVLQVIVPR